VREEKRKLKKKSVIKVKKIAEKWKIWNKSTCEIFEKSIFWPLLQTLLLHPFYFFEKKVSKRIPTKKVDHVIEVKKEFVLRKKKVYLLSREKREEMYKFIEE